VPPNLHKQETDLLYRIPFLDPNEPEHALLEQGRHETGESIVLHQLRRRCGNLPAVLQERVHRLSAAQLVELADALLGFTSIADAEAWITAHS
jgi:hypothetical protein